MHRSWLAAALIALALALAPAAALAGAGSATHPSGSIANFEGKQLDLANGWGDAQACLVYRARGILECFHDRTGLLAREQQLEAQIAASPARAATTAVPATATATCSSPLRLFADANYGGRELDFYDRGYWQNLSTWSFNNQLSSYKVGGCGVYLADLATGGGSWYPGNTNAGHLEPSMVSGWNDRISSIFIR